MSRQLRTVVLVGALFTVPRALAGEDVSVFADSFESGATCSWSTWVSPTLPGGCLIESVCYGVLESDPLVACQVCDPAVSETTWSTATDGTRCDDEDGLYCTLGSCTAGVCSFDAEAGTPCDSDNPCLVTSCSEDFGGACGAIGLGEYEPCGETTCTFDSLSSHVCIASSCVEVFTFCSGYACREDACLQDCDDSGDCAAGFSCSQGSCTEGLPIRVAGRDSSGSEAHPLAGILPGPARCRTHTETMPARN